MAGSADQRGQQRAAERSRAKPVKEGRLAVTEITFSRPGGPSPFGDDVQFPLPVQDLRYVHTSPS